MIWLKTISIPRGFGHCLGSMGLAGLALLAAFVVLAVFEPPGRAVAAPSLAPAMVVTFTLDDFDDPKRPVGLSYNIPRSPNDFFANQGSYTVGGAGALITDSLTCPYTHSCSLTLSYDVSAQATSEGGYVEELGYSYTYNGGNPATWKLRDVSACTTFQFRVQGDTVSPFTSQFQVEFIGHDWGVRDRYTVTGVTTHWRVITIPLTSLTQVNTTSVKQVAVRLLKSQITAPVGILHFDDFAFTGCKFEGNLLDLIERQAFYYFWETRHPATGFVRDRAVDPFPPYNRNVTSIAAIGYELAAFGIGAERGWISRAAAAQATLQVLNSLWNSTATGSHRGFYYHLLKIDTGQRDGDSELSTIDTDLLMAGVLFARQYFDGSGGTETAIRQQATQLFNRVEWDWALRTAATPSPNRNQFYLAWKPESIAGFEIPAPGGGNFAGTPSDPTTWDYYTDEILLINLLAIGSPTHSVPTNTFTTWARQPGSYDGYTLYQSWTGSLFTYFIGQGWLDLRCRIEPGTLISWRQNSKLAALANRQLAIDQAGTYATYSAQSWGLSAGLGLPDEPLDPTLAGVGIYRAYEALPKGENGTPLHDGTVAPYAAAGSIVFLGGGSNNEAYQALSHWYQTQPRLWGVYGFRDSFNLGKNSGIQDDWFAHDYIGIDQGMTLLALENYQTSLVWDTLNRDPVVSQALSTVFKCYVYLPVICKDSK
jgi:hypothetical protein